MFTMALSRMEAVDQILETSKQQWSNFMTDYEGWMANRASKDVNGDTVVFRKMKKLGYVFMEKSVFKSQELRSHCLNKNDKIDFFDFKHYFRNMVEKFIMEENIKTQTIDDLKKNTLARLTEWIIEEMPRRYLHGYWKLYFNRLMQQGIQSARE